MRTGRFSVEIDDVEVPGWQSVTIPSSHTEQDDGPDWGSTTFDDLEMERGVQPSDSRIFDWREAVRTDDVDEGHKEVAVILMDEEGAPQIRWEFEDAWIKEYHPPELDASDDDVTTESVVVAFDTMDREYP